MSRYVRRGYHPADSKSFTGSGLASLRQAAKELHWLLDQGYHLAPAAVFVSNHHQLTSRQRTALTRSTASSQKLAARARRQLAGSQLAQKHLLIDGFNLIISLETALAGSALFLGADGALRDLAGLRGSYRLIGQTGQALDLLGDFLTGLSLAAATVYLDAPVANSGRLAQLIRHKATGWPFACQVKTVPDPDLLLAGQAMIASSDSVLLDNCQSWYNLARELIREFIPQAWIVDLRLPSG